MSNNRFLKWTMGAPDKLEAGMLVIYKGEKHVTLIGHVDANGGFEAYEDSAPLLSDVERWTYPVRDFELQWYSDLAKGK